MALAFIHNKRPGIAKVPHTHNTKVILGVVPPTCTEQGYTVYGCTCGQYSTIDLPFIEPSHSFGELKADANEHWYECEVCGYKTTFPHIPNYELEFLPDDEAQVCTTCGYVIRPALHTHSWGDWEMITPATCEETGEWKRTCLICGTTVHEPIPALGHDIRTTVRKTPTCISVGERYSWCTKCNFTETETIEKVDHVREKIPAIPATCTEKGYTEGVRCPVCDTTLEAPKWISPYHIPSAVTYINIGLGVHMKKQHCTRCNELLLSVREPHTISVSGTGQNYCIYCGARGSEL